MAKAKLGQKTASRRGFKLLRSKPETKTQLRVRLPLLYNPDFRFLSCDQVRVFPTNKTRTNSVLAPPFLSSAGVDCSLGVFFSPAPQVTRDCLSRTKYFTEEEDFKSLVSDINQNYLYLFSCFLCKTIFVSFFFSGWPHLPAPPAKCLDCGYEPHLAQPLTIPV